MTFTTFNDDGQPVDHFPLPQELGKHHRRCLGNQSILELYNASHDPQKDVTDDVMQWVESEATKYGWKNPFWFNDSCTGIGCWLSPCLTTK